MQFGLPKREPEVKDRLTWDGTPARAMEIRDWARDAALLAYASVTPPDRNAAEGTPEATWRLQIKVPVAAEQGGGWQWQDVPQGSTIVFSGTPEDPTFSFATPRQSAQAFTQHDR